MRDGWPRWEGRERVRTIWIGLTFFLKGPSNYMGQKPYYSIVGRGEAGECCYLPSTSYYLLMKLPSSTVGEACSVS